MNKCYLKTPPVDNTLPYLFYTNAKIVTNNKNVFEKTLDETFTFQAQDVKFDIFFHFKLSTNLNQTTSFHYKLLLEIH
jgi:hypothetical protein